MFSRHEERYASLILGVVAAGALATVVFADTAAPFAVDSTADAVDARVGDGACRTVAGTCTLRAAIQEANARPGADEVLLSAGTYELGIPPQNQNDVTTGDLDITDSIAIRGPGAGSAILDGGPPPAGSPPDVPGLDRLFEVLVDDGTVAISGLTLRNGYSPEHGGAIANNSTASVIVTGVDLTGNVARKSGGALDNHLGGSIEVRGSTVSRNFAYENGSAMNNNRDGRLVVANSTVSANSAGAVGLDESLVGAGAISNNAALDTAGTVVVTGSLISDNRSGGGRAGAIANDGAGSVTVGRTTFTNNRASGDGGAIFNVAGDVQVSGSTFADNSANDGGAIYNSTKDGRLSVSGSTFSTNSASGRGGAIAGGGTGSMAVSRSTFTKNSAGAWGGAILNDDKGSATIEGASFIENAGLTGGGFANDGTGLVTVADSTFSKNTARDGALPATGEGGGVHSNSVGDVVITGGTFAENQARSGGALSNEGGGTLEIAGTRFLANHADEQGGAVLIQSGAVRMVEIDVVGNSADSPIEGGGGISYQGDKLVGDGETAAIERSSIRDNKSSGPGGGIDSRGDGPLAIASTTISGNTAAAGGGIHHVGDAPLEVVRSTLSGNAAATGGGVFSDGDGEALLENTTLSGNRAGKFGGGALVSSRLMVRSSTLAGNDAPSGGGINNGGGDIVGDGTVLLANTIVAGSPTGGNCVGSVTSLGGNLENTDRCRLAEPSDQPGTDPRLGPLADNGGPTRTHAILAGSPAQEHALCTDAHPCVTVDQRGVERPRFAGHDVGAYESELPPHGDAGSQVCAGHSERPVRADSDSWVKQSAPAASFGDDSILKVKSQAGANERALVRFPLPPVPPGCKLVGATLRLYSSAAAPDRTLEALRVATEWDELGVTWGDQPATVGAAAAADSAVGPVEWDVLDQARDMYVHGNRGFLIRDRTENGVGEQSFHSAEKGADNPPLLVLVFGDPDGPPRAGDCPTTPQSLSADRDSWVSEGSPANNFGSDSTLKVRSQVGYNSRALIRFPLPALPPGCADIASATLRVDAASAKEGRTLAAVRIASTWSEDGVSWGNQPLTAGRPATTASGGGVLEWAVTEQLRDMYSSGNHGLLIRDADENGIGDEQTLQSRDKLGDGPPELVLVFEDGSPTPSVDTQAPETTIDSGPADPSNDRHPSFRFSADEAATFQCRLDEAEWADCPAGPRYTDLADGTHTLEVRAIDLAGNTDATPAVHPWRVDATAPETAITAAPGLATSSATASFSFSATEPHSRFECSLDGEEFAPCVSPRLYSGLLPGAHEFSVRASDAAGNVDPTAAGHKWTISAAQACPAAATMPATADAWVDENSPTANKGSDSVLKVQSKGPRDNFRMLARFVLPALPPGCALASATLRLYAASATPGRTLHALRIASPWSEVQATWGTQPATDGPAAATASGAGFRAWDVTAQVEAMYGSGNHGFLIRDAAEGQDAEQQFHSREKGENAPALSLRFAAAAD